MVGGAINEFLVLGADPPALARLFALSEHRQQMGAAFDRRRCAAALGAGRHPVTV